MPDGKEFNKCDCGAPIWAMKVVLASLIERQQKDEAPTHEYEVQLNNVGVF